MIQTLFKLQLIKAFKKALKLLLTQAPFKKRQKFLKASAAQSNKKLQTRTFSIVLPHFKTSKVKVYTGRNL